MLATLTLTAMLAVAPVRAGARPPAHSLRRVTSPPEVRLARELSNRVVRIHTLMWLPAWSRVEGPMFALPSSPRSGLLRLMLTALMQLQSTLPFTHIIAFGDEFTDNGSGRW